MRKSQKIAFYGDDKTRVGFKDFINYNENWIKNNWRIRTKAAECMKYIEWKLSEFKEEKSISHEQENILNKIKEIIGERIKIEKKDKVKLALESKSTTNIYKAFEQDWKEERTLEQDDVKVVLQANNNLLIDRLKRLLGKRKRYDKKRSFRK